MTTSIRLYELLEDAEREGLAVPSGTKAIRTEARLVLHIADETGLDAGDLYRAFFRRPVRQARAIIVWSQREAPGDLEEQTAMILRWGWTNRPRSLAARRTRHLRSGA